MIKKMSVFFNSKPVKIARIIAVDLFNIVASVYVLMFVVMGFLHLAYINDVAIDSKSVEMTAIKIMVFPAMLYVLLRCFLRLKTFDLRLKERENHAQQSS